MSSIAMLQKIKAQAEKIQCADKHCFPEAASFGDFWRQGDLYITLLEKVPEEYEKCKVNCKLVNGTSQGSQHVLSHDDVEMFKNPHATVLQGPVFTSAKSVTIEHPEHGDVECPPDRVYCITYQQAYADVMRAVTD